MIPQRQTGASSRARETHGVMPNPRQVASEGKRSPSSKSALHKGFRAFFCELGNGGSPLWERGLINDHAGTQVEVRGPLHLLMSVHNCD